MKKFIVMILSVFLCFGLAACDDDEGGKQTTEPKEVKIMDCVDSIEVEAIEDSVIYWKVEFNSEFNNQNFDGWDFCAVIDECLAREESNADGIATQSVVAYDSNGVQRFFWGYPSGYEDVLEWDAEGQPVNPPYKYQSTK